MTTAKNDNKDLTRFIITDSAIQEMGERYLGLAIDGIKDKKGLAVVHAARMEMRASRLEVEKTRTALKAESLAWGRTVDGEAKRITGLMAPIEEHLVTEEVRITNAIKEEKEREAREVLEARLVHMEAVESRRTPREVAAMTDEGFATALSHDTTAFEYRKKAAAADAERQAEEAKRLETQKAELEEQRIAQEEEAKRLTEAQLEREAAEAEARKAEDARLKAERVELEQKRAELAKQQAAAEAKLAREKIELSRRAFEAETKKREAAEAEAEAKAKEETEARRAAMAPEAEKVRKLVISVLDIDVPEMTCREEVVAMFDAFAGALAKLANDLTA